MINLRKLFGFCEHEWNIIYKIKVYNSSRPQDTIGFEYHLQCKKCGKLKKRILT